ncbi:spore coat protein [Oceanobacillus alkalisoli]|uniref:spore coat protein n=1 Tax=Oceanobacillus alkalisoli TaxID=2925113 RepID=UPI001EF0A575|nr:spore coat protein [Oceanobacillus alkalisoli]MCF3943120.1 spore coat protein [Oceanobacillus alkalisoli]MCG5104704.1 spore coat protein [Oceanobacillus alkalisoli]
MSDSKQQPLNNKVVEVMVKTILRKNGVQPDEVKNNIPEEQKQMIKEMVEDLKKQVEDFQQNQAKDKSE